MFQFQLIITCHTKNEEDHKCANVVKKRESLWAEDVAQW